MRPLAFLILGLLLAATPPLARSTSAAPALQQPGSVHEDEPRGDRWNDRWQGRHHYLYDDAPAGTATDGSNANAQAHCRSVPVRVKRPDGSTTLRRVQRCD